MRAQKGVKVLITVPTMGWVKTELAARLEQYRGEQWVRVHYISNMADHAAARNHLAMFSFSPDVYTHWLMIDADQVPPPDFVERMLEVNRPIVSGLTYGFRPSIPNIGPPVVWPAVWKAARDPEGFEHYDQLRVDQIPEEGLLEGSDIAVGCFCMLVREDVMRALIPPYFKTEYLEPTQEKTRSEDLYFCTKVRQAGFSITVLPDLVCEHHKTINTAEILKYGRRLQQRGFGEGARSQLCSKEHGVPCQD